MGVIKDLKKMILFVCDLLLLKNEKESIVGMGCVVHYTCSFR